MNQNAVDERLASLKTMEAFTGTEIQVREFCSDWLLITYDIPHNEEGDKARSDFLSKAIAIGAVQHTESVYLLPWTPQAESMALDIASVGNAFLWISRPQDEAMAVGLTKKYDEQITEEIGALAQRLAKMEEHWQNGKDGIARRMMGKTWDRIEELQGAIVRRGSVKLHDRLKPLVAKLRELEDLVPTKKKRSQKKPQHHFNPKSMRFEMA